MISSRLRGLDHPFFPTCFLPSFKVDGGAGNVFLGCFLSLSSSGQIVWHDFSFHLPELTYSCLSEVALSPVEPSFRSPNKSQHSSIRKSLLSLVTLLSLSKYILSNFHILQSVFRLLP